MEINILTRQKGNLDSMLQYCTKDFTKFLKWIPLNKWVAHDLETTYTESLLDRKMLTAAYKFENTIWVLFIEELDSKEMEQLAQIMRQGQFIVQNVKFEIKEWKKYAVEFRKFFCTFLAEKTLNMGKDFAKNSLSAIVKRYIGIELDKELQTSFTSCIKITDKQVEYAYLDVLYLEKIRILQLEAIAIHDKEFKKLLKVSKNRGLKKTLFWTEEFIRVIADMEYYGVKIDVKQWTALYEEAKPLVEDAIFSLNKVVLEDFYDKAVEKKFIYEKDTFVSKLFSSAAIKLKLLQILYKDLEKTSQLELKTYLKKNDPNWPKELKATSKHVITFLRQLHKDKFIAIKLILLGEELAVKKLFYINFKTELFKLKLLIPKNTVNINWASPVQRKEIFKWVAPNLENTDKEHIEEVAYMHRIFNVYLNKYQNSIGKLTKFGMNYIKTMDIDGKIRTNINPVINTGRISSSKPNILNIINDKRYRAAFVSEPGYKFIMTDYQGEELVLTAFFAKEPLWLNAIRAGHDLHSINACKIYEEKWNKTELPNCKFKTDLVKCDCPEHKLLRKATKTVEFGSLYGMSKFGLAFKLQISVEEAEETLKQFFLTLPHIDRFMKKAAKFAFTHLYSPEQVLGACRFIDKKKLYYDKGSVARTSCNIKVQGAGANILKIATVLIRRHAKHLKQHVYSAITPYDEIILSVPDAHTEYWKNKLQYFMELAGRLALGENLLKTDPCVVADHWIH